MVFRYFLRPNAKTYKSYVPFLLHHIRTKCISGCDGVQSTDRTVKPCGDGNWVVEALYWCFAGGCSCGVVVDEDLPVVAVCSSPLRGGA